MKRPTIIHVNRQVIDKNRKYGTTHPVITVKKGVSNRYARTVRILGPSEVVYRPESPLSCGAKCWIETLAEVELEGEMTWKEMSQQ